MSRTEDFNRKTYFLSATTVEAFHDNQQGNSELKNRTYP